MPKKIETIPTHKVISEVANRFTELPKKITKEIIADFLNAIETNMTQGNKLRIDKIGILQVKERASRMGRNPKTGEAIKIPASKKIAFRVSKSLKEQVSGSRKKNPRQERKKF